MNDGRDMHPIRQRRAAGVSFKALRLQVLECNSLWVELRPEGRPCIDAQLLYELNKLPDVVAHYKAIKQNLGHVVLHSKRPGVFSLGGDLALFKTLIQSSDREGLQQYANACVEIVYQAATGYGDSLLTYALVQGDALGGGMETALTADCVVMEEQARMGLPEVLFNLFPGMGAPTFLMQKMKGNFQAAEELICSGRIFSAAELLEMGLCQHVTPQGEGEVLIRKLIHEAEPLRLARQTANKVRQVTDPVKKKELIDIVAIWVDAALRLSDRDLRLMDRLVRRQGSK